MTARRRILGTSLGLLWTLAAGVAEPATHAHTRARLEQIRGRLRKEAHVHSGQARPDRAPRVAFTVLPGDTHGRLAEDLTGSRDTEVALRKMEPALKPGATIHVPEAMLLPGLSDSRRDALVFGRVYPTLWSVARETTARTPAEVGRMARNIQRINAILYPDRLASGAKILVPRSLLAPAKEDPLPAAAAVSAEPGASREPATAPAMAPAVTPATVPAVTPAAFPAVTPAAVPAAAEAVVPQQPRQLELRREFRASDLSGLSRTAARLPDRLRRILTDQQLEEFQTGRGEVSLVVVHTTEHSGSSFPNTAGYIQRKRLANYLIGPDGAVYEIVPEEYRAFGCGDSLWEGRYGVDLEAINVEIYANTAAGERREAISDAQYQGLRALIADIRARRAAITDARVLTHRMVAMSYKFGMRSRKGDPYEFDWAKAGLPDNAQRVDPDVLAGRAKVCTDCRYTDRVTPGQTEAARLVKTF
ncbi:MAG: N-acetylmuramoyl-L-alanine amidase [Deltaproteobacteria bacterium]|nr:N-acetylmuramoyl-L-alanine amidase [Deltaproteobacteria bacterium]